MNTFLFWSLILSLCLNFGLAGFLHAMAKDLLHIVDVGSELYRRGQWQALGVSKYESALLWGRFRDALHLPKGTATVLGVGDPNA